MEGMIVLVTFTLAFIGIASWVYAPRNKSRIQSYGDIPFHEDGHER